MHCGHHLKSILAEKASFRVAVEPFGGLRGWETELAMIDIETRDKPFIPLRYWKIDILCHGSQAL